MAAATKTATLSRFNRIRNTSDGAKCLGANWARCYIHASWYDPLEKSWRKTGAGTELVSLYILDIGINNLVYTYIYIYIIIILYTYV